MINVVLQSVVRSYVIVFIIILTIFEITHQIFPSHVSMAFLERFNWDMKTHSKWDSTIPSNTAPNAIRKWRRRMSTSLLLSLLSDYEHCWQLPQAPTSTTRAISLPWWTILYNHDQKYDLRLFFFVKYLAIMIRKNTYYKVLTHYNTMIGSHANIHF